MGEHMNVRNLFFGSLITALLSANAAKAEDIVLEAESMATKTTGSLTRDGWNLWANGHIANPVDFSAGLYEFKVRARGNADQGAPQMRVRVNGNVILETEVTASYQFYVAKVNLPTGRGAVEIEYFNDFGVRKLYVEKTVITRVAVSPESPAQAPAPMPTPVVGNALKYAPPVLTNPIMVEVGTGLTVTRMDTTRDYIVKLPNTKKVGGTTLIGGRNVVVIGGHVTIPASANGQGGSAQRAFYIKDNKGTMHFEGLLIDSSGGGESDAFAISSPDSVIQIQNVRVNALLGKNSTWHADLIQPWGGVKELRVFNFTGSSHYQGFQLPANFNSSGPMYFDRVNIASEGPQTRDTGGQLIWVVLGSICENNYNIQLNEFYAAGRPEKGIEGSVWPAVGSSPCAAKVNATRTEVYWPNLPVRGVVKAGRPASGDFVPNGVAGVNYLSPGYSK